MKAAVYNSEGKVRLCGREQPEPQPGWLRINVSAVGICGTDLHIKNGALGPPTDIQPGHEVAGVVDIAGDDVDLASGTAVVVEPVMGCGKCKHCAAGMPNRCATKDFFGYSLPGGMAESFIVHQSLVFPVSSDLTPSMAALTEPVAVCVRGLRRGAVVSGTKVAIVGAGSIGLLSIPVARHFGASEIHIAARYPHQQAMAGHLGATGVYSSMEEMLNMLGNEHIDVAVETVGGTAGTLADAVSIAATGANIVMLGAYLDDPALPALRFMTHEHTLVASNCHGHEAERADMQVAIEVVGRYATLLEPLVTHHFKLDQVDQAFATAEDKSSESIKVQVHP